MTQNKTLIAVVNARHRQSTWSEAIRETWLPLVPKDRADVRFFVGRGEGELPEDTIALNCDDSYHGLPEKVREIIRWAYASGYEYVLKCDDDVVLNPKALLDSGYDHHKYSGRFNRPANHLDPYEVPMGFNYWLSRECMEILKDSELPKDYDDEKWVAENLYRRGNIRLTRDPRYKLQTQQTVDLAARMLRPPSRRPGRISQIPPSGYVEPEYFSWCVFLDVGIAPTVPIDTKIKQFKQLFINNVLPRMVNNVSA